jgi:DNA-binding FadR family transcriptional regulator
MSEFLYMDVSSQLEEKISKMSVGDKLPPERVMAEEYGVSRNVLREALRLLSEKGIIEIRTGKGAYVIDKKDIKWASQLESMIGSGSQSLIDIMEVRESLELGVFEKAVVRAWDEDILELEKIYEKMESNRKHPREFIKYDIEFHNQLAKSTHNNLYPLLISTFYNVAGGQYFRVTELFPEALNDAQVEHRKMIDAIKERNADMILKIGKEHFDVNRYISI